MTQQEIQEKFDKYAEEFDTGELFELLGYGDPTLPFNEEGEGLGLSDYKLIEEGRGLKGFSNNCISVIFEVDGQTYGVFGEYDSWAGSAYDTEIKKVKYKQITINKYSLVKE